MILATAESVANAHPDAASIEFKCPGCMNRRNRADETHYGPDCRRALTQPRARATQRRPFGRRQAHDEPTAGLRGSSLGAHAEQDAEARAAAGSSNDHLRNSAERGADRSPSKRCAICR